MKTFAFFFTFLLVLLSGFSGIYPADVSVMPKSAREYFKILKNSIMESLPDRFTGELTGRSIASKLNNIPRSSYLDGKQRIYVQLAYSKKKGIAITVQNVEELYRDLYQDLPKQIYAFDLILSSENNNNYLNKYDISYVSKSSDLIVIRLGIHSAENSILLFINPDIQQIQRIDYLLGKQALSSTTIAYSEMKSNRSTDEKKYRVPVQFHSKVEGGPESAAPDLFEINHVLIP